MSEWKNQVEEKARHTAIMYVLENENSMGTAARTPARKRASSSDRIFGFFALFMSVAMGLIAAGFYAVNQDAEYLGGNVIMVFYVVMCVLMLVSGIRNLIRSLG